MISAQSMTALSKNAFIFRNKTSISAISNIRRRMSLGQTPKSSTSSDGENAKPSEETNKPAELEEVLVAKRKVILYNTCNLDHTS